MRTGKIPTRTGQPKGFGESTRYFKFTSALAVPSRVHLTVPTHLCCPETPGAIRVCGPRMEGSALLPFSLEAGACTALWAQVDPAELISTMPKGRAPSALPSL